MYNKCKYECDLEILAIGAKIDKEIIDMEAKLMAEIIKPPTNCFRHNSLKEENKGQTVFLIG